MNAFDMLAYGHKDVMAAFDGLADADWSRTGVTTRWTPKDLLAHLASFERVLEDAMREVAGDAGPTPTLDAMRHDRDGFNEAQVGARRDRSHAEVLAEYQAAQAAVTALAERLGAERLREVGTIPWYGAGYSLDDLIVYANYAHKREHCAQLRRWKMDRGAA